MMSMAVFMVNYQCARVVLSAISIANIATPLLNLLFIVLAQQRHYIIPPYRFKYCVMCYNIFTYKSPPKVRWAGIEPANRLHGGAFQMHRVCLSTTSANRFEGDKVVQTASPSNLPNEKHIILDIVLSNIKPIVYIPNMCYNTIVGR